MTPIAADPPVDEKRILKLCRETLSFREVYSSCFYGPRVYSYAKEKADINVLLVLSSFPPKIRDIVNPLGDLNLSILAISRRVFEDDIEKGQYGELASDIITLPYKSWINRDYMKEMETKVKKRFILELLKSIVRKYPELSMELLINPQYFMYEVIRRRLKLFPPSEYSLLNIFRSGVKNQNINIIMEGYLRALAELEAEGCVQSSDGYTKISRDFAESSKRESPSFSNILMKIREVLSPYTRSLSSRISTGFLRDQIIFRRDSFVKPERELLRQLEETEKHLLMPTPLGLVPLSDKTGIKDFVQRTIPGGEHLEFTVEEMGGVLNSVYLLKLKDYEPRRIVVKRFEDWLGWKWFPLALWTLGTQSFAVLGKTRLEREYSINQFLSKHGFTVPRILYVSLKECLIFEDFVEGKKISELVKEIIASQEEQKRKIKVIQKIGREIARVHSLQVSLGDCKPENIILTRNKKICFLDLEQATRNGNQTWDIAEFLYYSGHYILPIHSDESAKSITNSFVGGYLNAGGKKQVVKKAASIKYTKVFSVFTLPHIILAIANICRKTAK